ncbi:unnamed protein product [Clonostachys rosea]|uniref:Zn(2)-C6 fungal-type domain-containing protein n=1 Tax=Bionectria ochroleuca TaxID=29856 RepID=A0ABY6US92_BIOOC|nr:unnamed protein product [Clonostachys rosea]
MHAPDAYARPSPTPPPATQNPYSCLPCRGKKKKCDRTSPCLNCRRLGTQCLYVPRRQSARQPPSFVLAERLQRLEDTISRMQKHLDPELARRLASDELPSGSLAWENTDTALPSKPAPYTDDVADLGAEFGRLALENGRSRYIIGNSWASLDDEVQDLKSLLQSAPQETEQWYPTSDSYASNHAGVLGLGSPFRNLSSVHPPPERIPTYWRLFKKNCDILIKVLHVPTVEPLILQATRRLDRLPRGLEALMMALYFSVAVSLSSAECLHLLGSEKAALVHKFKLGTDHALAQAELLETDEIITLQALAIYLTGLRIHCSARVMSTLTALLVRLASNAGIHRDGTHFKMPPFMVEMRRRLWWSICVLDSRASEDTGYDSMITLEKADTQLPLNVNDSDLYPEMTHFPQPAVGLTDMTFSVVRFESVRVFHNLQDMSLESLDKRGTPSEAQRLKDKNEAISRIENRLNKLYLKHLDPSIPLAWFTSSICSIVLTKMRLVTYHPYLRKGSSAGLPPDTRDRVFAESIAVIEDWLRLNRNESTQHWKWLCETYFQWYALTFLLSELCERTCGRSVDRAWTAVDEALRLGHQIYSSSCQIDVDRYHQADVDAPCCGLYKPLGRLLKRARSARGKPLESEAQSCEARKRSTDVSPDDSTCEPSPAINGPEIQNWEPVDLGFVTNQFIPGMPWQGYDPDICHEWLLWEAPQTGSRPVNHAEDWLDRPMYLWTDNTR